MRMTLNACNLTTQFTFSLLLFDCAVFLIEASCKLSALCVMFFLRVMNKTWQLSEGIAPEVKNGIQGLMWLLQPVRYPRYFIPTSNTCSCCIEQPIVINNDSL